MLDGFDDLKAKDIIAFDQSGGSVKVLFMNKDRLESRQLTVTPNGTLSTREIEPVPIDQEEPPKRTPVAQRWATTDQGAHVQ